MDVCCLFFYSLFIVNCIAQLVADVHIGDITSTTAMVIVINDEIYSFSLASSLCLRYSLI